jgi:type II secretory pathway component PulF
MSTFRYQALGGNGGPVGGVVEAEDRKAALQLLGRRGLYPSSLEISTSAVPVDAPVAPANSSPARIPTFNQRVTRKDITAFTREMSALLGAAIPIPQALDGLAEEENPTLRSIILTIA